MNIILLGAPGAGKGTQAFKMAKEYNIPHISTGDIFRSNIKQGTPIGLVAKSYIDAGKLVPDEVTVEIVKQRLEEADCKNGYLLDGFPRTVAQAQSLATFTNVEYVVNIYVELTKLLNRLTGRRVCPSCGNSYHIDFLEGKTTCDNCSTELIQRADDNEQTVGNRLNVYSSQTAPLIEFYEKQLVNIDGEKSIDQVFAQIKQKLG